MPYVVGQSDPETTRPRGSARPPGASRGPGRPPGVDSAETRRRILHSARRVFSSRGFDQASLKEIAEAAGLTRNAIANYFPSKAELHAAAFASIQQEAVSRILVEAGAVAGPVDRRVFALFDAAVALHRQDDSFVRFLISSSVDATHHPELREHSLGQLAEVREFLRDALTAAAADGELAAGTDPAATAQVLTDLLWGLAMDIGFLSDPARIPATLAALDRVITAALRPTD